MEPLDEFRDYVTDWLVSTGRSAASTANEARIDQSLFGKYLHADPHRRVRPSPRSLEKLAPVLGDYYEDLMRMCGYLKPNLAAGQPMRPPRSAQQRHVDQEYDRWMAVMVPRMGTRAAHNTFWDPIVSDTRSRRETLERALYAPPVGAVYDANNRREGALNSRLRADNNADNDLLRPTAGALLGWLTKPRPLHGATA